MKKINLINIFFLVLLKNFIFLNLYAQINNSIVAKVGDSLITTVDVQNEIITNLIMNKQIVTQLNIDKTKNFAIKSLITTLIKKGEIDKYKVKDYNKKDLENHLDKIAKNNNTDRNGIKKIFDQNAISYSVFVKKFETELIWNSLIFEIYRDQINVNIVDVENEVRKMKQNKSDEELKKIKKNIINKKKERKLDLFSRSHFSNLENTVSIDFK